MSNDVLRADLCIPKLGVVIEGSISIDYPNPKFGDSGRGEYQDRLPQPQIWGFKYTIVTGYRSKTRGCRPDDAIGFALNRLLSRGTHNRRNMFYLYTP